MPQARPESAASSDPLADPARLAAVSRVLEAWRGSAGLDRLTALAADLLGVGSAQVSLLAEQQVVASVVGPGAEGERTGPVEDSLCTVTVRSGGPLQVQDASSDARVSSLPPVTSGAVGAYFGVPLVTSDGHALGALCAYDPERREWSEQDAAVLQGLADSAVAELELRVLSQELATRAAQLDLALTAADIGSFDLDVATGALHWDDRLVALFGYERASFGGRLEDFDARVHPEDLERVRAAMARSIDTVGDFSSEYRVVRPDGTRWVEARGRVLRGPDGRAARLLGVAYDSTELREARDRLARVLDTMGDAFYSLDPQWRFTFVNAEAERLLGRTREDLLGSVLWEQFPATLGTDFETEYRGAVAEGQPAAFEAYYPPPLDGWYELRAWPTADGLSVYFREITERRRAEQEREQAVVERERAYAAAEAANQRLAFVADASHLLAQTLEPYGVLERLSELVLPSLGESVWVALVGEAASQLLGRELPEGDAVHVVHVAHVDPRRREQLERLARVVPMSTNDAVGVGAVIRTGVPEWLPEVPPEALEAFVTEQTPLEDLLDVASATALTVPLLSRGRVLGAVTVGEPPSGQVDRALVTDLAARAAVALDNALLYGAERRTGLTLQRSLLPGQLPKVEDLEIAVRYLPGATGAFVGGDWYQGVLVGDQLVLCMGDVMGHGMRSAARMGQLRAIVATLALEGHGPGELLTRLAASSDALLDLELATLLVGRYDPAGRTLVVASAGHPPPLLAVVGEEPRYLDVEPGPPVGSFPAVYAETVVDVPSGATLVLYTDGLVEQRDEGLDVGLEALRTALCELQLPPEAVADHVLAELGRSSGGADDVALLVLSHASDTP